MSCTRCFLCYPVNDTPSYLLQLPLPRRHEQTRPNCQCNNLQTVTGRRNRTTYPAFTCKIEYIVAEGYRFLAHVMANTFCAPRDRIPPQLSRLVALEPQMCPWHCAHRTVTEERIKLKRLTPTYLNSGQILAIFVSEDIFVAPSSRGTPSAAGVNVFHHSPRRKALLRYLL